MIQEKEFIHLFAEVTKIPEEEIPLDTPLSMLGIDSLQGIELLGEIEDKYGIAIAPEEFFQGLTGRHILDKINQNDLSIKKDSLKQKDPEDSIIPLTENHKGFWAAYKLADAPLFHSPYVVEFQKEISVKELERIFKILVERHPILKAVISIKSGVVNFIIQDEIQVKVNDLGEVPLRVKDQAIDAFIDERFDLIRGPLFRVGRLKAGDKFYLILVLHHIIEDGWSFKVFTKDFSDLLNGKTLQDTPVPFKEYIQDLNEWLKINKEEGLNYWKNSLPSNIEPLHFSGVERKEQQDFKGVLKEFSLEISVHELTREQEFSPAHCFLALYFQFLASITENSQISVGIPFFNRTNSRYNKTFGCFFHVLPVTLNKEDCMDLNKAANIIKERISEGFKYAQIPFPMLVQELKVPGSLSHHPIYQALFLYEPDFEMREIEFPHNHGTILTKICKWTPYDIELWVLQKGNIISFNLLLNQALFSEEIIENYFKKFKALANLNFENKPS